MIHKFLQVNLQHSAGASAAILRRFIQDGIDAALIQEPWVNIRIKGLNHKSTKIICDHTVSNTRAAILIRKDLNYLPLNHHISKDLVAIQLRFDSGDEQNDIVIAFAYFPGDDPFEPSPQPVQSLISFCIKQGMPYIIGCDANSHHSSWGSTNINNRGESLYNYFLDVDSIVLNEG